MLSGFRVQAHIPVTDLEQARSFYSDVLGLDLDGGMEDEALHYLCGDGTRLVVFRTRESAGLGHTAAGFVTTGIEEVVAGLRDRGVEFQDYDLGEGMATTDGILTIEDEKAAWLTDPEGNVIVLIEETEPDPAGP